MYHITKIKEGTTPLLFFNGYGAPKENLSALCKHNRFEKYAVYYLDINTTNPKKNTLKNALVQIEEFLATNHFNSFSVAGYSVGGRMALQLAHKYPDKINELILLAPDGIQPNFWFSLVTKLVGKQILPQQLFQKLANSFWVDPIVRISIPNKKAAEWVKEEIQSPQFAQTFYATWILNHNNILSNTALKNVLENTTSILVIGKFDAMLPPKKYQNAKNWCKTYIETQGSHALPSILKDLKI